jgi:hypothetical protein
VLSNLAGNIDNLLARATGGSMNPPDAANIRRTTKGAKVKVIITGSREIEAINVDEAMAASGFKGSIDEVVSGGSGGVNMAGEAWAALSRIPVKVFHANWERFGKSADLNRNEQMVAYADALVLIWNGRSTGIRSMRDAALRHGLKVYIHTVA